MVSIVGTVRFDRKALLLGGMGLLLPIGAMGQQPGEADARQTEGPSEAVIELAPEPAPALSTVETTEFQTIIVTAGKREQDQRDVAGSVDVLSGAVLEGINAQSLADYLKQVPGVTVSDYGPDNSLPIIRGISTSTAPIEYTTTQQTVGIYIGEMPYTDLYMPYSVPDLNPFDLERVEILKGPQGTLFGSGALSGAIRYLLKQPELGEWQGKFSGSYSTNPYSDEPSTALGAAVNLPLNDASAALRIVGVLRKDGGIIDEVNRGRDLDALQQKQARVLGLWDVSPRLDLSGFFVTQQSGQGSSSHADNPHGFFREQTGEYQRFSRFSGSNLLARYHFDGATLLSSSNYLTKQADLYLTVPLGAASPTGDPDGDGGENGPGTEDAGDYQTALVYTDWRTRGLFQEFRLASPDSAPAILSDEWTLEWLLGLALQNTGEDVFQVGDTSAGATLGSISQLPIFPIDTPQGPVYGDREGTLAYLELDSMARETSVFGEITAGFADRWRFSLGLRAFKTRLKVDGFVTGSQIVVLSGGQTQVQADELIRAQGVNPKLAVSYLFRPGWQLYAMAAKGFQFGGVQVEPPLAAVSTTSPEVYEPYRSSKLWSYELGIRGAHFDEHVQWELTLFEMDWRDMQITVNAPMFPNSRELGLATRKIENIGRARSRGAEAGVRLAPWPSLRLSSAATWISARTTEDFDSVSGFVSKGTRLPGSPRFQWSNVLDFTPRALRSGGWNGGLTLIHARLGRSHNDLHYFREQGGYDTLDVHLRLGREDLRARPQLSVSLLNVEDVRGVNAVFGDSASRDVGYYFVQPRTLQIGLDLRF